MSDLKISELPALSGSDLASSDQLAVVDSSASQTSKLSVNDLIANGVTLISDDTIPGAKILFAAGDVPGTALADSAVTTAKIADDAVTAAKLANNSSVTLVTSLPASGDFTGQLALDTDDNSLYAWDGSAWQNVAAQSSIAGSTAGEINIVVTTSGTTTTISATIDDTTAAAQFLAGPTGSAGTVGYRTIVSTDLPTATSSAKGAVIVNGDGLALTGDTIGIDNTVTSSSTHHVVTYDVNGLITGGRAIAAADLPIATSSAVGGVIVSDGLTVDVTGNLSIDNTVTAGTYTKVTVTSKGVVSAGDTLVAADIPDHSADKLTSGTIGTSLIANDAITADKIGDQATTKFGGAAGSDNVTIFPTGDYKGQFFYDETTQDLYIYTGSAFVPITVLSGNLVNAGAYNASTNQMSSVTSAGSSAGFSVGNALPAPAKTNLNHYVVVDTSGTGTGAAPAVALAPPDMLLSQGVGTEYSLIDVSNAIAGQTASNISLIATGDITATDVQAGITELDTEKLPKAGGTMTGNLELNNANVVFEGSSADDYETTLTVTNPTADRSIVLPDVSGNIVTTGDTGTVTSTMITDGTIVNADINASAEIAVSKLANGTARQLLETAADGASVQFASNIDIPGTLDVTGAATFDSTASVAGLFTSNGRININAGTASAPGLYFNNQTGDGIYHVSNGKLGVTTAGYGRIVIDGNKIGLSQIETPECNVHIGQISGDSTILLEAAAATGSNAEIKFGESGTATNRGRIIYPSGSGNRFMSFEANGSEAIRITNTRDVGIGTSTPNNYSGYHALTLNGTSGGAVDFQSNGTDIGSIYSTSSLFIAQAQGSTIPLTFRTNSTERLRIDSSGNVGVGNTAPGYKLSVLTTGASDTSLHLATTAGGGSNGEADNSIRFTGGTNSRWANAKYEAFFHLFHGNGTERMRLSDAGQLLIGTTSPSTSSVTTRISAYSSTDNWMLMDIGSQDSSSNTGGIYGVRSRSSSHNPIALASAFESTTAAVCYFGGGWGGFGRSANQLRFYTSADVDSAAGTTGNERMRIDSSGNVGFGESNPLSRIHVAQPGSIRVGVDSTRYFYMAYDGIYSRGQNMYIWNLENYDMRFATNNSERMRIDTSGNIGIGTTSPDSKLHITGGTVTIRHASPVTGTGKLAILTDNASEGTFAYDDEGLVRWGTATDPSTQAGFSEKMRLDSSGNLGVGTSSPANPLHIASQNPSIRLQSNSGSYQGRNTLGQYNNILYLECDNDNAVANSVMAFTIDATERMRLDSSGQVNVFASATPHISRSGTSAGTVQWLYAGAHSATSTSNGTVSFQVYTNGNVQNTNDSYGQISDIKLKENIVDAESQWDDFKAIRFRKYNFKEETGYETHTQLGVIAQELELTSPGLVYETPDRDEEGNVLSTTTKAVKSSILTKKGLVALQEAMERIEQLEAKVAALEAG